jgi:hypothetical protein
MRLRPSSVSVTMRMHLWSVYHAGHVQFGHFLSWMLVLQSKHGSSESFVIMVHILGHAF